MVNFRPSTVESLSSNSVQRLLLFLLCLLLLHHPSLAYSLNNCTFDFTEDALAEVCMDCTSNGLVSVPDDIPRNAHTVKLSENQIREIKRDDFVNMAKLSFLSLDSNVIAHIDDGSFMYLVSLKELHMASNYLPNLTGNLFQGLSNLSLLDLSNNQINFIHTSAFDFLTSLKTVILNSNKLETVTDIEPVLKLPHLQVLRLKHNLFSTFESKDLNLNTSSSLKVLDVEDNDIMRFSITTPIFPHLHTIYLYSIFSELEWDIPDKSLLTNITHLELSYLLIDIEETQKVLQSLDSLQELQLNFMWQLFSEGLLPTVCKIPTLRSLDLSVNDDADISAQLGACSQLKELYLGNTNTSEIPKGSLSMMKQLRLLDLRQNLINRVPEDIRSLSSLRELRLGINRISELSCEDFTNTTSLTELFLNNNPIAKLDRCTFQNLNNLKVLNMSGNKLWTFEGAFKKGLPNLEILHLGTTFVSDLVKGDFEGLKSLKQFDIESNDINVIRKGAFDTLYNLTKLSIYLPIFFDDDFSELQQLEDFTMYFPIDASSLKDHENVSTFLFDLKSLRRLKMVCISNQGLIMKTKIEMVQSTKLLEEFTAENIFLTSTSKETFQFNSKLRSLRITKTYLSDVGPELFWPLSNLQTLDLSSTNLKSLDFLAQANLSALKYLHLSDNGITVIDETIFQSLPALIYLDLSNNPLTCDCSNAGFIQWVKSNNQTQVDGAHDYICFFPLIKQGTKVLDFDVQSCWMDVGFLCYISSSCLVVLTLLTSFIYHLLRWQIVYAFLLFQAFLYDSRKRRRGAPHLYDAFISYNVEDEAWVYREMLPVLEGEQGWRLCLHHRDFQPGKPIIENITDAIYSSRKTICVISRSYLQSEWCSREIQMASFRLFDEKKDVLILLFVEEIPSHQLSPYHRMRKLVKKRTYLSWPQAGQHKGVFWQNVRRALETGESARDNVNLLTGPEGC